VEPGQEKPFWECRGTLDPAVVPAGAYRLFWQQSEHGSSPLILGELTVEAGRLNDRALSSGIVPRPADWVPPQPYYFRLKDGKGNTVGSWRELAPQLAPPGSYSLVYRQSEHRHGEVLWGQVMIPRDGFAQVELNSGLRFLHGDAPPPYRIILVNLENRTEISAQETWEPLLAPPGRYRLDWWEKQHGSKRTTVADEVVVEPGTLMEVEL
jgi:Ca-activated chloride channel family protein